MPRRSRTAYGTSTLVFFVGVSRVSGRSGLAWPSPGLTAVAAGAGASGKDAEAHMRAAAAPGQAVRVAPCLPADFFFSRQSALEHKTSKYRRLCQQRGMGFVPIVFTTSGGMGEQLQRRYWNPRWIRVAEPQRRMRR
jgi:hypothetical protein